MYHLQHEKLMKKKNYVIRCDLKFLSSAEHHFLPCSLIDCKS